MSLLGSIQVGANSLQAAQIGLQVVGNNIANANTPGYIRQRAILAAAPPEQLGDLVLGLGVQVQGIRQQVDRMLEERLRGASSDVAGAEVQEDAYLRLESLIGELGDADLSTALNDFFSSINDVLNQPESVAVRNLAVLRGDALTDQIRGLDGQVRTLIADDNSRIVEAADEINGLLTKIAALNVRIVTMEAGVKQASDAVGLRDERQAALSQLAELMDIRAVEQESGAVMVFSGGDYLVFDGIAREVKAVFEQVDGLDRVEIRLADTDAPLAIASGEVGGLVEARDEILGGFLDRLNDFARLLAFEFNKIHSGGQGLAGYGELTSEFAVEDVNAALDQAGLPFTPVNGSFQVQVRNKQSGLTETTDIPVRLNGLDDDTSLTSLAAALSAVEGLEAEITPEGALTIRTDSSDLEFSLANDTSGLPAALGVNTFFSGSSSQDLAVNPVIRADPKRLAASRAGIGVDTQNAVALADLLNTPLESEDGDSLAARYDQLMVETTNAADVTRSAADGLRHFQETLEGQQMAISGVSLDEEAVRMLGYQHAYQASARYIAAVSSLLDQLMSL